MKLTDEQVIRRAVELADGWLGADDPNGELWVEAPADISPSSRYCSSWIWDELPQELLDALAAQLVRQCQGAGYQVLVCHHWSGKVGVSIYNIYNTTNGGSFMEHYHNTTICRAIVESGVLE